MLGKHRLGIYEKAFNPQNDWRSLLGKARDLGFDFVEISIDESDARIERLYWSAEQIEQLRRTCYEEGISIQTMCLSAHRRFPFGSADPEIRRKAYEIMQRAIDFAYAMGIRVIQLAGYDVYYEPSTPESVRLFKEGMIWAAEAAAQKQVMLAMEIMDTPFMNSITKNMEYESMIHSPWYRVYPDVGNISAWPENDVDAEIAGGIDSIVAVHLKDTLAVRENFAGKFKCVPFGSGCVDFRRRFLQFEKLGYAGTYVVEMWYSESSEEMAEIQKAKRWVEKQYSLALMQEEI